MTRPPRTHVVCPWCGVRYRGEEIWACLGCATTALLEGLVAVTEAIANKVAWLTCQVDGCLVRPGEHCPACEARDLGLPAPGHCACGRWIKKPGEAECWECARRTRPQKRPGRRRQKYNDTEDDPKRPVAWVRRGLIQYPVYRESGAA